MSRPVFSSLEPLEARIAPASLAVYHPIADIIPSQGQTGTTIDLSTSFDADSAASYRTHVVITTNYDTDPLTPGVQAGQIVLELFDDKTPLTVENFLAYVKGLQGHGDYADTFFHRALPGFVLQGGGFSASDPTQHIQTYAPVHTEANPSDPELSNATGTVAMALSTGPSSGQSEFFINLANNNNPAGNDLDTQNGGFTVFAKVISGMDVANAIANLPKAEIGDTSGNAQTPYQNGYNPDPDGNSSTAAPIPKANQLVDITSVKIEAPTHAKLPGVSYSVVSITDDATGEPTHLVTGSLSGSKLSLHYGKNAGGVADVTVQATDRSTGQSVQETFQVKLTPNLVGQITTDPLTGGYFQIGDTATATTKITNTGGGTSTGQLTVSYYLSAADGSDPLDSTGLSIDANDQLIGSFTTDQTVNLAGGASYTISSGITIPADGSVHLVNGTSYYLLAKVGTTNTDPLHGNFYTDDDVAVGQTHPFVTGTRAPDVTAKSVSDDLPLVIVPGETGTATLTVENAAQPVAHGNIHVQFYLVENTHPGTSTDGTDLIPIGSGDFPIDLALNKTATVKAPISIPTSLDLDPLYYRLVAVVSDGATDPVGDVVSTDNKVSGGTYHALVDKFGTFTDVDTIFGTLPIRKNVPLTYTDPAGNLVTLEMSGAGSGTVAMDNDGGIVWTTQDTTKSSALKMSLAAAAGETLAVGTHTLVKDILAGQQDEAIGKMKLGLVDWTDAVQALGGVKKLVLGDTSGTSDHVVSIGGTSGAASITLGLAQDTSLVSSIRLALLSATNWTSVNGDTQSVQAPSITAFQMAGDFTANLTVSPAAGSTGPAVQTFTVDGTLQDSMVSIGGNVGTVKIGAISGSEFFLGASAVPQAVTDFNVAAKIGNLRLGSVTNSEIAAAKMGTVKIGDISADNGGSTFGVLAGKIASYTRGSFHATNLAYDPASATPGVVDADADYQVTLLPPE